MVPAFSVVLSREASMRCLSAERQKQQTRTFKIRTSDSGPTDHLPWRDSLRINSKVFPTASRSYTSWPLPICPSPSLLFSSSPLCSPETPPLL